MASLPKGLLRVLAWFDSTADELKALINDDGRMPVSIDEQNVNLDTQSLVYDGSGWVKQGMVWSYHSKLHAVDTHTQVGAGAYTMTILTVPEGYVYVANAITSNNASRALKHTHQLCDGAGCMNCYEKTTTGAGELVINSNLNYVLSYGNNVKVIFTTSQNGDYMVGRVWGYAMKVDM